MTTHILPLFVPNSNLFSHLLHCLDTLTNMCVFVLFCQERSYIHVHKYMVLYCTIKISQFWNLQPNAAVLKILTAENYTIGHLCITRVKYHCLNEGFLEFCGCNSSVVIHTMDHVLSLRFIRYLNPSSDIENQTSTLWRRYSEFDLLRNYLQATYPGVSKWLQISICTNWNQIVVQRKTRIKKHPFFEFRPISFLYIMVFTKKSARKCSMDYCTNACRRFISIRLNSIK